MTASLAGMVEQKERGTGVRLASTRHYRKVPVLEGDPPACADPGASKSLTCAVPAPSEVSPFVDEIEVAVSSLLGARVGKPMGTLPKTTVAPSATHAARERWSRQVVELGEPPPRIDRHSLLQRVLKSTDTYNLEDSTTRRPCRIDHLRVARDGGVHPKRIRSVCGPEARHIVEDPLRWICRDDDELRELGEDRMPVPFTDGRLRDPKVMRQLLSKLAEAGVLVFGGVPAPSWGSSRSRKLERRTSFVWWSTPELPTPYTAIHLTSTCPPRALSATSIGATSSFLRRVTWRAWT